MRIAILVTSKTAEIDASRYFFDSVTEIISNDPRICEKAKDNGICYAESDKGVALDPRTFEKVRPKLSANVGFCFYY